MTAADATPEPGRVGRGLVGEVLDGRYVVESELGSGGMGTVYLGTQRNMGRRVVVKVPHPHFLHEPGFRERFEKEIRALTVLEHPHVVKVLDAGRVGELPYAVLQWLGGGNLKDRVAAAGGRLAPTEVAEWLPAVAQALDFVHRQRVVHRDVKPANILFDSEGHVFLADFGIAKALASTESTLTPAGYAPGSPAYMAPEQALGAELSGAADQYALATVVYEVLGGRAPHEGTTPIAVLVKKQSEDPPALRTLAPNVSSASAAAVMRALSRDPAKRFPTCAAFAAAFADGLRAQGPSGVAPAPDETRRATPFEKPAPRPAPSPPARVAPPPRPAPARAPAPERGRARWPLVVASILVAGGGVAAFVASRKDDAGKPATPAALTLVVTEPAEGALLSSRTTRVRGRITGPADAVVHVNGSVASRSGDGFEWFVVTPDDVELQIRVHAFAPGERTRTGRSVSASTRRLPASSSSSRCRRRTSSRGGT
jgi:hypothetical protein